MREQALAVQFWVGEYNVAGLASCSSEHVPEVSEDHPKNSTRVSESK